MDNHHSTPRNAKKTNLWPYGILLTLALGIILISISVYISVKHPIYDDRPFFQTHASTDAEMNTLLESTTTLQEQYRFYIQANTPPTRDSILQPTSPYIRPPHREKLRPNMPHVLITKMLNTLYVRVDKHNEAAPNVRDLDIHVFLQKIGESGAQVYIYNANDNAFMKRVSVIKGAHIPIGVMAFDEKEGVFISPSFEIEQEGRWLVSLQITQKPHNNHIAASPKQALTDRQPLSRAHLQEAQEEIPNTQHLSNGAVVLEKEFFSMAQAWQ